MGLDLYYCKFCKQVKTMYEYGACDLCEGTYMNCDECFKEYKCLCELTEQELDEYFSFKIKELSKEEKLESRKQIRQR